MLDGLERLFRENGSKFIIEDISQLVKSSTNPREFMQLYKYLFDAIAYELKDPQGKRDYSSLDKVIERNKKYIKEGRLKDKHPNVLLFVVGHLENPSMYRKYANFFRDNGIAHIYWIPLHHFQDTETNSEYFIEMAEYILKETGKERIDVIPHSRGGLVTSYAAMTRPEELSKFNTIINVGTPFHGTFVANLAYYLVMGSLGAKLLEKIGYSWTPVKQMMYCSDFTEKVSSFIGTAKGVDFYSLFSLNYDEAVIPGVCSIIDSSNFINIDVDEYLNLKRVGHAGLTQNQNVVDLELQILKGRFDKEKFKREHTIMTFEEYRREREGKRYQGKKSAGHHGNNLLNITPEALNMIPNPA